MKYLNKSIALTLFLFTTTLTFAQVDEFGTNKIEALLYHINRSYVDSVENEEMGEDAIRGILEELDPHSSYIPADELRRKHCWSWIREFRCHEITQGS